MRVEGGQARRTVRFSSSALVQAWSGDKPVVRQTVRFWRASSRASNS